MTGFSPILGHSVYDQYSKTDNCNDITLIWSHTHKCNCKHLGSPSKNAHAHIWSLH